MKFIKFLGAACLTISLAAPAVARESIPNFSKIKNYQARKEAFFKYLLPKVQRINLKIRSEREKLISLRLKEQLNPRERTALVNLAEHYQVKTPNTKQEWSSLLQRVDTIPPSMVLAQAANESAWGSSRFARLGSNLFGQWCYHKGCGLVPQRRNKGAHHEVKVFSTISDSIESYMHNLNTNRSYDYFREIRAQNRQTQPSLKGEKLVEGLVKYSQRGEAYVKEIRHMIVQNHLDTYDT